MSDGPRMTLDQARQVAKRLMTAWGIGERRPDGQYASLFAGSIRRQRPLVGDIDIVAPAVTGIKKPVAADDPLFARIDATMSNPYIDQRNPLFAGACPAIEGEIIGTAVKGLKPGFLAASIALRLEGGGQIPVQVFRYVPSNRGWVILQKTGPSDFGKWFLGKWKEHYGIPRGVDDANASVANHLLDGAGEMVHVPTEAEAFRLCGLAEIPPEQRDAFIENKKAQREAMR